MNGMYIHRDYMYVCMHVHVCVCMCMYLYIFVYVCVCMLAYQSKVQDNAVCVEPYFKILKYINGYIKGCMVIT